VDEKTKELIDAIEAYMRFHLESYESPAMNEARTRIDKAILSLKTEN
jgi:hypothetical protein